MPSRTTPETSAPSEPRDDASRAPSRDEGTDVSPLDRVLSRVNPGWPFLLVGLAALAAVMLVPAWRDLISIKNEHALLSSGVDYETRRVARTEELLDAVNRDDSVLRERLVAWQWNLVPQGQTALARELHTGGVLGWIDDSVEPMSEPPAPPPASRLESLVTGERRNWFLAGGMLCVFVGLAGFPDRMRG